MPTLEGNEAALRRLLMEARDEAATLRLLLADMTKERDRWLKRLRKLERRLQEVAKALDHTGEYEEGEG